MESVDRWLLGRVSGEAHVVCLPTAAGTEGVERISYWSRLGVEHFTRLGAQAEAVEVIDRRTADNQAFAARIQAANFVYLSGGRPDHLLASLSGSAAWAAIMDVLAKGGVVAGCSAGAMIFGQHLPTFPTLWPWRPAFGFLPGAVVFPHFDELSPLLTGIVRLMMPAKAVLVGVEGNTALTCARGQYQVVGSGGVMVWDRAHKRRYVHGENVPWSSETKGL
jgi:cyanophycinase